VRIYPFFLLACLILLSACKSEIAVPPSQTVVAPPDRIHYNGQDIYLSGFNIAWFDFAQDAGKGLDEKALRATLEAVKNAGGNSLRWWMHTDGSLSPDWGTIKGKKYVIGAGGSFIEDLKQALDIAAEYQIYIVPSLWSFDMLKCNDFRLPPNADNYRLLSEDDVLQSYISNALIPMVKALNKHPQLIAWELFNEPENMTESWMAEQASACEKTPYTGPMPSLEQLQKTQAKLAAAIHATATTLGETALVTTGSKSMGKYNSDVAGGKNWYRDDRMIAAAGGDPLAILDFYEPHYYNNEGKDGQWSPFHHNAAYWGVDKPIVVGEFHPHSLDVLNDPVSYQQLCERLFNGGYAGGWPWQWADGPKVQQEIQACLARVALPK